jgi:hypothetical protein
MDMIGVRFDYRGLFTWLCKGNAGQSLIEVALSVPIFVLLLVGAAEFGTVLYAAIEVSDAARAGVYMEHKTAARLPIRLELRPQPQAARPILADSPQPRRTLVPVPMEHPQPAPLAIARILTSKRRSQSIPKCPSRRYFICPARPARSH